MGGNAKRGGKEDGKSNRDSIGGGGGGGAVRGVLAVVVGGDELCVDGWRLRRPPGKGERLGSARLGSAGISLEQELTKETQNYKHAPHPTE